MKNLIKNAIAAIRGERLIVGPPTEEECREAQQDMIDGLEGKLSPGGELPPSRPLPPFGSQIVEIRQAHAEMILTDFRKMIGEYCTDPEARGKATEILDELTAKYL